MGRVGSDDEHDGRAALPTIAPPGFRRREVVLAPGEAAPYAAADWEGAIVLVDQGDVEFECRAGGRRRFPSGSILFTDGLDLRLIRNPGPDVTVLVALDRRGRDPGCG